MTAINVIRQNQAVHILSDGAFCDATGIVCEIGPNAFALPHLPAALAIRGSTHFMPFLVHRLSRECRSFDDGLGKIAEFASRAGAGSPPYDFARCAAISPSYTAKLCRCGLQAGTYSIFHRI